MNDLYRKVIDIVEEEEKIEITKECVDDLVAKVIDDLEDEQNVANNRAIRDYLSQLYSLIKTDTELGKLIIDQKKQQ